MINNRKVIYIMAPLLLIVVLLIGGVMPYFLFYFFIAGLILPIIHNLVALKGLKGQVQLPKDSLYIGEQITIGYRIENRSLFYIPYLEVRSSIIRRLTGEVQEPEVTSLESKRELMRSQAVTLKRRGYYVLGDLEVVLRDVFRLFTFQKQIKSEAALMVYPEIISLSSFAISASQQLGELRVNDPAYEDKSRIASLRGYLEGDSMKRIHWKMTAKKGDLIVKNYENRGDTQVAIFIDNEITGFRGDVDRRLEDKVVDGALCVTNYCLEKNIDVTVETQADDQPVRIKGSKKTDIKPFLEAFALFKGDGQRSLKSIMTTRMETLGKGATVLIVTPSLNKENGALGIQLKMSNLNPLFMVITDNQSRTGVIDSQAKKMLKQEGVPLYLIDVKTNIKEYLEGDRNE